MLPEASPERGGGCAEGADGGVPLVTIADTDQQRKEVFIKKTRKKITRKEPSAIAICGSFLNRKIY